MGGIKLDHVVKNDKMVKRGKYCKAETNGPTEKGLELNNIDGGSSGGTGGGVEGQDNDAGDYDRGVWARKLEFILSVVGYSVGVGNIWRFPYLVMQNGGGAFLIPFVFFLVLCGVPLFFLELSLGQFSGTSSLFVWKLCPLFKGLGYLMIVVCFFFCWYYIMVLVWVLVFLFHSFLPELPWSSCDGWWNSPGCIGETKLVPVNYTVSCNVTKLCMKNATLPGNASAVLLSSEHNLTETTASKEFWINRVLEKSSGLEDFGTVRWHLCLALVVAWVIVFLCLMKGVKSIGKVVYVTALLPYVLLTIFLIKGLTLPGAVDGILFYITPDFKRLFEFEVWLQAGVQVFYSLGPAWGGLITMASYNKFNNNCLRDALICTVADGFTSLYGGFVIFSVIGYMAKEANKNITDVATSGPGLALVVYPEAISKMPLPQLWAILFFLMLLTLGIDSQFGVFETMSAGITDAFPVLRKKKVILTAVLCMTICILDLPFTTNGGIYLYQLVDWYFAAFCVLLTSFLECFIVAWIYGAERFEYDIYLMLGRRPSGLLRICWCFITPAIMLAAFLISLSQYAPPDIDGYTYPTVARIMGNILAVLPILPLPVVMIWELYKANGSFPERFRNLLKPASDWGPRVAKHKQSYNERFSMYNASWRDKMMYNLLGIPTQNLSE